MTTTTTVLTVRRAGWVVDVDDGTSVGTLPSTGITTKAQAITRAKAHALSTGGATINIESVKGKFKETVTLEAIDGDSEAEEPDAEAEGGAKKFGFPGR